MNYEKKYKEALERARDLMTKQNPPAFDENLIGIVFPELKESEDGRVRKAIIRILKGETGYTSKEDTDKYVTWLEEQKEKQSIWTDSDRIMAFTLLRDVDQITYISNEGKKERMQWLNSLGDKFNNGE